MRKRATKTIDVLDAEVDFERFGPARRNAFAGSGERGGPSLLALWEMPQLAPTALVVRRGPRNKGTSGGTDVRPVCKRR